MDRRRAGSGQLARSDVGSVVSASSVVVAIDHSDIADLWNGDRTQFATLAGADDELSLGETGRNERCFLSAVRQEEYDLFLRTEVRNPVNFRHHFAVSTSGDAHRDGGVSLSLPAFGDPDLDVGEESAVAPYGLDVVDRPAHDLFGVRDQARQVELDQSRRRSLPRSGEGEKETCDGETILRARRKPHAVTS